MKFSKLILSAMLLAGFTDIAAAATEYIYIAGAPAFRRNSNNSIANAISTLGTSRGLTATSGNSLSAATVEGARANQWRINDWPLSGDVTIINATWTGSSSGIQSVASGTIQQLFINTSFSTEANRLAPKTSIDGVAINTGYQPVISLSNTFQSSTLFEGTKTFATGPSTSRTDTYATLYQSEPLAISAYRFVASKGFPVAGNNVTSQFLEALFRDGPQSLSFLTGSNADAGKLVYATGRDNGSGLRIATQAETGVGLTTQVQHYKPTVSNGTTISGNLVNGTLNAGSPPIWPAGTVPSTGLYYVAGNTGYIEFGGTSAVTAQLAALTSEVKSGTPYYLISSLEDSDAATAIANGAVDLTYNGVSFSITAIQEGKYPFWAYQRLYRSQTLTGTALTFANQIESSWVLPTTVGTAIDASTLNVERFADGGVITPK